VGSEPENETPGGGELHHSGTVSPDGLPWFGYTGFGYAGDEIAGFGEAYPGPGFSPALDAVVPAPASRASVAADAGSFVSTSDGSGPVAQTQGGGSGSGLVIDPIYDSSITDLQTSNATLYGDITGAITAAIDFYETAIVNPITLTIDFGYGEVGGTSLESGAISESTPLGGDLSYNSLLGDLQGAATSAADQSAVANLPSSDPFGGSGADYFVPYAEVSALRGVNINQLDGDVGLSSSANFTYDPNDRAVSGDYDAIGALEHEISEVMGRIAYYPSNDYSALDLFRYTSSGDIATDGTAAYFSIDGGKTNLDTFNNYLANGGDAGDWSTAVPADSYDAFSSMGVANTVSATDLTEMDVLGYTLAASCYAAGTRILTVQGEVRIEDLPVGDMVQARFAGLTPIKWIGHRRIDCRRHPDPHQVWPVRIVAGAFGPDQPCRDLFLSPDHAVAIDGALVPIRLLINGASVRQETAVTRVHYFHIELARHDLLVADGLAAESYLETGNRGMFANADAPLVLHPQTEQAAAQQQREAQSCLPLLGDPARVEPVWRALATRAERLGMALPVVATTHDPALCIVSGTMRFTPIHRDGGRYIFGLPVLPHGARLRSRCAVPSDLRPWLGDRRRLGVMVRGIVLRSGGEIIEIAPDDPCLADGWWAAERDASAPWRWTNGDAALPPINDVATLEVLIGDTPPYPLAEPACAGQVAHEHAPVHGPRADSLLHEPGNSRAVQR
jgi:hypothetical protein